MAELVTDDRATHFWDEGLVVPEYFGDRSTYDVGYAFGPEASWGDPPAATGQPVVLETAGLSRVLTKHL